MEMAGLDVEEWIGRTGEEAHVLCRNYLAPGVRITCAVLILIHTSLPNAIINCIRGGLVCLAGAVSNTCNCTCSTGWAQYLLD